LREFSVAFDMVSHGSVVCGRPGAAGMAARRC
jgi:hypothetical protein